MIRTSSAPHGMPSRLRRSATWARSCGSPLEVVYCKRRRMLRDEQVGVDLVQLRDREQRGIGVAAAEGDDVGVGAEPQAARGSPTGARGPCGVRTRQSCASFFRGVAGSNQPNSASPEGGKALHDIMRPAGMPTDPRSQSEISMSSRPTGQLGGGSGLLIGAGRYAPCHPAVGRLCDGAARLHRGSRGIS